MLKSERRHMSKSKVSVVMNGKGPWWDGEHILTLGKHGRVWEYHVRLDRFERYSRGGTKTHVPQNKVQKCVRKKVQEGLSMGCGNLTHATVEQIMGKGGNG